VLKVFIIVLFYKDSNCCKKSVRGKRFLDLIAFEFICPHCMT